MIRMCTCIRGSASEVELSQNRLAASCKSCGGKRMVDGIGTLSVSMVSTVELELSSAINSDLTWKTVSKGNRSASRRARKLFPRSLKESEELLGEDPKKVDMPVSESEKLGVTILGGRFSDKIAHVPIKKRRSFRSPSPLPQAPSSFPEEHVRVKSLSSSGGFLQKNSEDKSKKLSDEEDFSGISILAAVACNNDIAGSVANSEEGLIIEQSCSQIGSLEVLVNAESSFEAKNSCKEDMPSIAETLNDGTVSCISVMAVEENTGCPRNLESGNAVEGHLICDTPVAVLHNPQSCKANKTPSRPDSSLWDSRSNWDLNTIMDTWENPSGDPTVSAQENVIHDDECLKLEKVESFEELSRPGDSINDIKTILQPMVDSVVLGDEHKEICRTREEDDLDACSGPDKTTSFQKNVPSEINEAISSVMDPAEDTKPFYNQERFAHSAESVVSALVESALEPQPLANTFVAGDDHVLSTPVSEESKGVESLFTTDDRTADIPSSESISLISMQEVENHDIPLSCTVITEKAASDIVLTEDGECVQGTDGLCDDFIGNVVNTSNKGDNSQLSPNGEELSTSCPSVGRGEPVAANDKVCEAKTKEADFQVLIGSEHTKNSFGKMTGMVDIPCGTSSHEPCRSYSDDSVYNSGKVAFEEDFDDSDFDSDVSLNDVGIEKPSELQADYDSQYEDGELRESIVHTWEDAGEEGEAEHVDYGSDNRDTYGSEAVPDYSFPVSEQVENRSECKKEGSAEINRVVYETNCQPFRVGTSNTENMEPGSAKKRVVKAVRAQGIEKYKLGTEIDRELNKRTDMVIGGHEIRARGDALKESTTQSDQFRESRRSSINTITAVRYCNARKPFSSGRMCGGVNAGDSMEMAVGSITSRRELPSRIEVPTSSDVLLRKDSMYIQGSRSTKYESSLHIHGRGQGPHRRIDSSGGHWGLSRRNYGSTGFGHRPNNAAAAAGPNNAAAAAAAKLESNGFLIAPDGTILKASGIGPNDHTHRRLTRKRSPSDRDEAFDVRDMSPDRSIIGRGRSERYRPRVIGTGPRERYHGPMHDDTIDSPIHMQHPSSRRERSFSPIQRRGAHHLSQSHTKSPSRSRTRSPHVWSSPRRRNSGETDFRSEARNERMRSPHRRPGFETEHIVGFRGTPQHAPKWIDDGHEALDHFRERGYKQRFPRSQRFDFVDSSTRMKVDEYYRPMHAERFPQMVGGGRGYRYEGSDDDRRKNSDRYRMVHPVRHYDTEEGGIKRFRYDMEGDGRNPKDYDRSINGRLGDAPRNEREEKSHFRYGRDGGKYGANSKSFGMRESEEDIAPRRTKPS